MHNLTLTSRVFITLASLVLVAVVLTAAQADERPSREAVSLFETSATRSPPGSQFGIPPSSAVNGR